MGTRNLTCVVVDGEYRVAQYGQWDGYPEGGGVGVLNALLNTTPDHLKERVLACREVSEEEVEALWKECGADGSGWVNMAVSKKMNKRYPTLHRDMGWKIIEHLNETDGEVLVQKALEFAGSGLFCEWGYVIDLDQNTFEVYKGFSKERHTGERFSDFHEEPIETNDYAAIRLVKTYSLDDLPTEDEFLNDLTENDDEEEEEEVEVKKKRITLSTLEMEAIVEGLENVDGEVAENLMERISNHLASM